MNQSKSALIIIDLQNDFTRESGKAHACIVQVNSLIPIVNELTQKFIESKQDVIYLKTAWSNPLIKFVTGNSVKPGTWGAELDSRLEVVNQNIFIKENKNAFSCDDFVQFLRVSSIEHLYLTGLAIDYCLKVTSEMALNRGYRVTIVEDGVAAYKCQNLMKSLDNLASNRVKIEESDHIKLILTRLGKLSQ